jgi:hypothetical protein
MAASRNTEQELKDLLNEAYERLAGPSFIPDDPIQIPKSFADRKDAETIGFLTATIAWGQRKTIIANARKLVHVMDEAPHDFVMNASVKDLQRHRPAALHPGTAACEHRSRRTGSGVPGGE